jgi:alkanesulfonate monooxygenase SsuD/methylene tetrahydromethanopterin reductase-like flavin-dependent oxidoreductase (luciferase family)
VTRIGAVLPTRGLFLRLAHDAVFAGVAPDFTLPLRMATRAEEVGLDAVWAGDSLTAKPRLEPLTVLAAVAARTTRIGLGTSVLLAPLRQPVLLAQSAATVHLLSGGRLTLGMGVGGSFNEAQQAEWRAAGVDPSTRGSRMAEIAEILPLLWRGEPVSFQGRHFRLDGASLGYAAGVPGRFGPPRVLLACHSGEGRLRQYERAARFADGIFSITDSPQEFAEVRRAVLHLRHAEGPEMRDFAATFYMTVNLNEDEEAARAEADAWIRAYYGVNFWGDRWGPFGAPRRVVERAREYIAAGATDVAFRFAARDQLSQLESFAREVLPALR